VRQLAYDFRPWRQLEATGRSGGDDGFDARGYEGGEIEATQNVDDAENDEAEARSDERVWLIQCKRERTITPKKLNDYLGSIPETELRGLHGIIFAAACDFSKKAHDLFRSRTRELGFAEAYLWSKAEIEDLLFQPKNDHLLFAYCGVSLQMRKRSLRTDVRARLATKRKATKVLLHREVLVRDAADDRYPYLDENKQLPRIQRGRWKVFQVEECCHDGVHLAYKRHRAFLDDDGISWDFDETDIASHPINDPWLSAEDKEKIRRQDSWQIWADLPENNKASFEEILILPYENILAIDEDGDDWFNGPQVYTTVFEPNKMEPFRPYVIQTFVTNTERRLSDLDEKHRVKKLPRQGDPVQPRPPRDPIAIPD
jgi:hypothetical protein